VCFVISVTSLMTQWFFNRGVIDQTKAFMTGFNEVLPLTWLQYFDEREFEVCTVFLDLKVFAVIETLKFFLDHSVRETVVR